MLRQLLIASFALAAALPAYAAKDRKPSNSRTAAP